MSLDSLPADQRAVLQLVLKQGQSYDDIAGMLGLDRAAVQDRARKGVAALGPDGVRLSDDQRGQIADYLLGQQGVGDREATRDLLAGSAKGRAWAQVVSDELAPLAGDGLPEIPEGDEQAAPATTPREDRAAAVAADRVEGALPSRSDTPPAEPQPSRLGGALLIAGLVILVVVAVILIARGGGDDNGDTGTTEPAATQTTGTSTTAEQPKVDFQINLQPLEQGSRAQAQASFVSQGGQRGVAIIGTRLKANKVNDQGQPLDVYTVWLYSSGKELKRLGFASVKKDGKLDGFANIDGDPTKYKLLIVSRETTADPKKPGTRVLAGAIKR